MSFIYNMTDTWNNGATVFTAIKMNVTDTASSAASLLMDLQIAGTSKFQVTKTGQVLAGTVANSPQFAFTGNTLTGFEDDTFTNLYVWVNGVRKVFFTSSGVQVNLNDSYQFSSTSIGGTSDIFLQRDAAGTLAQRNSTNAQLFSIYNTYTDASNYERLEIGANAAGIGANTFGVAATKAGTGTDRDLYLFSNQNVRLAGGGQSRWHVNSSGMFLATLDNTYDIGASGATRPRNIYTANDVYVGRYGFFVDGTGFFWGGGGSGVIGYNAGPVIFQGGTVEGLRMGSSGAIFNYSAANYDIQFQGQTSPNMLFLDASAGYVGIGTASPSQLLHVSNTSGTANFQFEANAASIMSLYFGKPGTPVYGQMIFDNATRSFTWSASGGNDVYISSSGKVGIGITNPSQLFTVASTGAMAWDNGAGTADTMLIRDGAAATLALKRAGSTASQEFRIYKDATDASNYSYFGIIADSSVAGFRTINAGTAIALDLRFGAGSYQWAISASTAAFLSLSDNNYDIGASGASRPRSIYAGTSFVVQQGTITSSTPQINGTVTWNNAGVQFIGWQLNVTNSASANTSKLTDWKVGGTSVASIRLDGSIFSTNFRFYDTGSGSEIFASGAGCVGFYSTSTVAGFNATGFGIDSTLALQWGTISGTSLGGDLFLYRDAANTLAQRNGTNSQIFRLYNTYTDASNFENLEFGFSSNVPYIRSTKLGTGTARALNLGANGTNYWQIDTSGNLLAVTDNSYDIGAGTNRPKTINAARLVIYSDYVSLPANIAASQGVAFAGGGWVQGDGSGNIAVMNNAQTGFGLLMFGGTSASFPALKRSTTTLQARLADDTDFAGLTSGQHSIGLAPAATFEGNSPSLQVHTAVMVGGFARYSADTVGGDIWLAKSRNATVGSHTIVQSGDILGEVRFAGSNGTSFDPAAAIKALVDGTPGASTDMPGRLSFLTTTDGTATLTEALRIDNAQRLITGNVASQAIWDALTPQVQLNTATNALGTARYSADATGGSIWLAKSRNATVGSHTIVQSGDTVGILRFAGSDGTNFISAAAILGLIDATPGASNDMPGRLSFQTTTDGTGTLTERLRIDNAGNIVTGNVAAAANFAGGTPIVQIQHTGPSFGMARYAASSGGPIAYFAKSRNATVGSHTIVQNGDDLGRIIWCGSNGTDFINAVQIQGIVGGTPGTTNDMPGAIIFSTTPDGSGTLSERLRIDADGQLIGTPGSVTPATLGTNGQYTLTPTSNTNFRISFRGTDGTTRVGNITLA